MRFSVCKTRIYEQHVQNGLSLTPEQMGEMASKGVPISTANLGVGYQDGVSKLDFQPPLEYTRGIDMNDLWQANKDVSAKLKKNLSNLKTE